MCAYEGIDSLRGQLCVCVCCVCVTQSLTHSLTHSLQQSIHYHARVVTLETGGEARSADKASRKARPDQSGC